MANKIQVDVWAGDMHQKHAAAEEFDTWAEAAQFMEQQVEAGLLCNVLHTDFKTPPERVEEMTAAVLAGMHLQGTPDADA